MGATCSTVNMGVGVGATCNTLNLNHATCSLNTLSAKNSSTLQFINKRNIMTGEGSRQNSVPKSLGGRKHYWMRSRSDRYSYLLTLLNKITVRELWNFGDMRHRSFLPYNETQLLDAIWGTALKKKQIMCKLKWTPNNMCSTWKQTRWSNGTGTRRLSH